MLRLIGIIVALSLCALPASGQCTKDMDCKGNRICLNGQCVEPQSSPSPQPAAPAQSQPAQPAPASAQPTPPSPSASTPGAIDLANASYEVGIALGPWFGGTVNVDGNDLDKDASFMLKTYYDGYLIPKLAMGVYMCWVPSITVGGSSRSGASIEFGGSIKPRFLASPTVAIKPALEIGYRNTSFGSSNVKSADGMALNFNVQAEFAVHKNVVVFGAFGFLAQPVGGNGDFDFSYAPIFFLNFGAGFGKF
jgi:hypothetical protein